MSHEHDELAGHRALVTGAGRGIGRAIALELAARGAQVTLVGRNAARRVEVAREIEAAGGRAEKFVADIAEVGELDEFVGGMDVLVHNAASFAPYAALEDVATHELDSVFATGLAAVARLDGCVLGPMKERGLGRLLYVGSHAGAHGAKHQAAYAGAKAGLVGLMRSAALEGARFGVTANLLSLGLVNTERIQTSVDAKVRRRIIDRTPVGRMGEPEEVADAAAFLASPRASFITGAVLPVSGGLGLGLYPEQLS